MVSTFILSLPAVSVYVLKSDFALACNMFGIYLDDYPLYLMVTF